MRPLAKSLRESGDPRHGRAVVATMVRSTSPRCKGASIEMTGRWIVAADRPSASRPRATILTREVLTHESLPWTPRSAGPVWAMHEVKRLDSEPDASAAPGAKDGGALWWAIISRQHGPRLRPIRPPPASLFIPFGHPAIGV
jgi:hypothetical protein